MISPSVRQNRIWRYIAASELFECERRCIEQAHFRIGVREDVMGILLDMEVTVLQLSQMIEVGKLKEGCISGCY